MLTKWSGLGAGVLLLISGCTGEVPVTSLSEPELPGPPAEHSRALCAIGTASPTYCEHYSGPVTANTITQLLERCSYSSVEELLAALPESYRRGYALMYESKSLQQASPLYPRAIVFGENATTVMSFNGSETQEGHDTVEIIEWNETSKTFSPYELRFDTEESTDEDECESQGHQKLRVTLTTNPNVCFACHGYYSFRPNWAAYNVWQGAYGSVTRGGKDGMHSHQPEARQYEEFLKTTKNTGRYRFLPTIHPDIEGIYAPDEPARISYTQNGLTESQGGTDANETLTHLFTQLNYKRIANDLILHPHYPYFKNALMALTARCIDLCADSDDTSCRSIYPFYGARSLRLEEFYPDVLNATFDSYETLVETIRATGAAQMDARYDLLVGINEPRYIDLSYYFRPFARNSSEGDVISQPQRGTAALKLIADRALVMTSGWSLDFELGEYNLQAGRLDLKDLFQTIFSALQAERDPELPQMTRDTYDSFEQCLLLKDQSLSAYRSIH